MSRTLLIARAELVFLARSRMAAIGIVALVCLSAIAGFTSFAHMERERASRATHQLEADAIFEAQPDRHPHRMVHYGQYAYRPVSALSAFDPGVDPYTGTALYLEGHRQNSATFSAVRESSSLIRFGSLTPAFVLQTLAPLLLVFVGFSAVTRERESGALNLLRMHGTSVAQVMTGKGLALFTVATAALTPAWLALAAAAYESPAEVAAAGLIAVGYAVYLAIWTIAIVAISALVSSGRAALLVLVILWSLTGVLAPRLAADTAQAFQPLASRAETDLAIQADLRRIGDSHDPDDPFFVGFRERMLALYGVTRVEDLPFNYRGALSAEGETLTSRLFDEYAARTAEILRAQSNWAQAWSVVSPAVALRRLSMSAAASDLENHLSFLRQAEAFRYDFVQRLNALHRDAVVFADDAARSRDPEAERRTRIAAANWAELPDFRFVPASAAERAANGAAALAWLLFWLLAVSVLAVWSAARLVRSPA